MSTDVEISFITPVYNTSINEIQGCINSIINQGIESYEIILINDGSTIMETNQYCEALSNDFSNIKYVYQQNSGSAVARNKGLDLAVGKYIFFVDDDDQLAENFYNQFQEVKFLNFDVMIFDYSYWTPDSNQIHSLGAEQDLTKKKEMLFQNIMFSPEVLNSFFIGSIWSKCFSRTFINDNKIRFVDKLRKAQDRMFMLEVILAASSILYVPINCYKYRLSNLNSISHRYNPKMLDYYHELYLEMRRFCEIHTLNRCCSKYLEYGIVIELTSLVIFNAKNDASYIAKRHQYYKITQEYNLKGSLRFIKYSDCSGIKACLRLCLFKSNLFLPLYIFYTSKNNRIKGNYLNTNQ